MSYGFWQRGLGGYGHCGPHLICERFPSDHHRSDAARIFSSMSMPRGPDRESDKPERGVCPETRCTGRRTKLAPDPQYHPMARRQYPLRLTDSVPGYTVSTAYQYPQGTIVRIGTVYQGTDILIPICWAARDSNLTAAKPGQAKPSVSGWQAARDCLSPFFGTRCGYGA